MPGHTLRGLDLRYAKWAVVDLDSSTFVDCGFRGCDIRGANPMDVGFERCRLEVPKMEGAHGEGGLPECCVGTNGALSSAGREIVRRRPERTHRQFAGWQQVRLAPDPP